MPAKTGDVFKCPERVGKSDSTCGIRRFSRVAIYIEEKEDLYTCLHLHVSVN